MALRDLIPWRKRGRDVEVRRGEESNPVPPGRDVDVRRREESNPLPSLLHEMDQLFDAAFRGFDFMPSGSDRTMGLPNIEVTETDQEVKVTAEVPGLDEKDLQVEFADGVLAITGEKKSRTEEESNYSRFERQIAIDGVDEDNVAATFKDGVLTVTLRRTGRAQRNERFI
jgi:HSP20 family protein